MFIMPKHVFSDFSYATTMSNMIKETTKNVLAISNEPYYSCN